MNGSDSLVFWIVPLFVTVGLYLVWYSRRRKKLLDTFASFHHLRIRPDPHCPTQTGTQLCVRQGIIAKAGEGTRTLDIQLGKLTLYQLSYTRCFNAQYSIILHIVAKWCICNVRG